MNRIFSLVASLAIVVAMTMPLAISANAQHRDFYDGARSRHPYDDNYDRRRNHHDDRYYDDHRDQGGIGPGKGALIGGAGGAALGALFGGGLKGALIGGGAGAGVGAIAGKVHQDNQNHDYRERYDRYGRPY